MEEQVRKLVWEVMYVWRGFPLVLGCDLLSAAHHQRLVAACCPQRALTNLVADVAELPLLPPNPRGLPLACGSRSFIDSALLGGDLLLTRHKRGSGAQLFPAGALSLCWAGTTGRSAGPALSRPRPWLGCWRASVGLLLSEITVTKVNLEGGRNALVLRQALCSLIARGAFVKVCARVSTRSHLSWAVDGPRSSRESRCRARLRSKCASGHLKREGCGDLTEG